MHKIRILVISIILISVLIGIVLYPYLPEQMASHWNAQGEANGYSGKFWGTFLLPIITLILFLILIFIPRLDPLKSNLKSFEKYYETFILIFVLFLTYLHLLILIDNLDIDFNFTLALIPAFSVLFYYVGILISKVKRNYFIGIRTPWTLNSEEVWNKTHQLGGKLFKVAAIVSLSGLALGKYAFWIMLLPILGVSLFIVVYSYWIYRKINSKRKL
ncbi:MAG: SdpI family protein [Candidatus Woesearchaeota archaeon]